MIIERRTSSEVGIPRAGEPRGDCDAYFATRVRKPCPITIEEFEKYPKIAFSEGPDVCKSSRHQQMYGKLRDSSYGSNYVFCEMNPELDREVRDERERQGSGGIGTGLAAKTISIGPFVGV